MAADTPVPEGAVSLDFVVSIKMMWRGVISGMAFARLHLLQPVKR